MRLIRSIASPACKRVGLIALVWVAILARSHAAEPFVDITTETGLDFIHFNGMSGELYFAEMMGAGGALLDYDGDGDLDVYLVQGRMLGEEKAVEDAVFAPHHPVPLTDRLYRNDLHVTPGGETVVQFTDVTESSGLVATGYGMGVAVGDADNDGLPDIYVTNLGSNQLWHNNGDGTFTEVTARAGADDSRWSVPAVFTDFNGDGWLDLFVGNYVDWTVRTHKTCTSESGARDYCSPQAFASEPDLQLINRGGTFEDVTREAGLLTAYGPALGAAAEDFNGDGRIDLYVANDGEANQLWLNGDGEGFVDEALLAGAAVNEEGQPEASMGIAAGDIDDDGDVDLFLTHLERETNTLYANDGSGLFEERSRASGLGMSSWQMTGFGTALVDYDGDGVADLVTVNGAVTIIEEQLGEGDPLPLRQRNQLYHGLGGGRFEEVTAKAGVAFEPLEVSRGLAVGDVEGDGDTDLLITNNAGPARLLVDPDTVNGRWLGLRVLGPGGRDALGARVVITAGRGPRRVRSVRTDGSYASASDPRVLVSFEESVKRVSVDVRLPGGQTHRWLDLPSGHYVTLPDVER